VWANLQDLHARLVAKRYRHQPIRRVTIPKEQGKTRPIGISAFEDKLVQDAVREVLEAIYEQDFLDGSYGFRPGRSAHDAIRTLDQIVHRGEVSWILEADVVSFFDSIDRNELKKMLELRVADGSLLRLIGKCLQVGVLDGAELSVPETGTSVVCCCSSKRRGGPGTVWVPLGCRLGAAGENRGPHNHVPMAATLGLGLSPLGREVPGRPRRFFA